MSIREILEKLLRGEIDIERAERMVKAVQILEIGNIAKMDVLRELRSGAPEIILAEGKSPEDLVLIVRKVLEEKERAIISRASKEHIDAILKEIPLDQYTIEVHEKARIVIVRRKNAKPRKIGRKIGIIAAGTSDIPVAEEARVISEELGCDTVTAYDVGIAGIHRLFPALKKMIMEDVDVIIVIAGMEGALPSIVASLVDLPVIGVPSSSGYGYGGRGVAALMGMLQTCVPGLAVVNIDNGVHAAVFAYLISKRVKDVLEKQKS